MTRMDDQSRPFLSVIMPVFNGARTLARTLESVLKQREGIELITVIQACSDGSREMVESYSDRIRTIIVDVPANSNWIHNTNIGLARANAPLCCFLHQDDVWNEGRLDALRHLYANYPRAALWIHDADFIDDGDRIIGRFGPPFGKRERIVPQGEFLEKILTQNTLSIAAAMFRRDAAHEVCFLDETLWYTADWDFWLRLASCGEVVWLPRRLAGFRLHLNSLTVSGSRRIADFRRQMEVVVDRYVEALPGADLKRVKEMAEASIALNVFLAAAFHRGPFSGSDALLRILRLGLPNLILFLRYSQIRQRLFPRLRAIWSSRRRVAK